MKLQNITALFTYYMTCLCYFLISLVSLLLLLFCVVVVDANDEWGVRAAIHNISVAGVRVASSHLRLHGLGNSCSFASCSPVQEELRLGSIHSLPF